LPSHPSLGPGKALDDVLQERVRDRRRAVRVHFAHFGPVKVVEYGGHLWSASIYFLKKSIITSNIDWYQFISDLPNLRHLIDRQRHCNGTQIIVDVFDFKQIAQLDQLPFDKNRFIDYFTEKSIRTLQISI